MRTGRRRVHAEPNSHVCVYPPPTACLGPERSVLRSPGKRFAGGLYDAGGLSEEVLTMGMVMTFTAVTPEQLAQLKEAEEDEERLAELADEIEADPKLSCDLDKSDEGLSHLLSTAGVKVPLELYINDMIGGQEDLMLAGWSTENVRRAAQLLNATPFDRLAEHYDPERMAERSINWHPDPDDREELAYLRGNYESLVRFFDAAARSGLAAIQRLG
jgi:hypothetical protein